MTAIEDQNGTVISQGFDDLDRLIGRDIDLGPGVGGDTEEAFAYDALGRLTEATDDDSTFSAMGQMTYDSLSRVLTEAQGGNPLGDEVKTVSYAWDAESGRTLLTYPSGFEAHEERDVLGRLTAIEDGNEATVAAFDLYGGGLREKKRTLANGTYAAVTYDGFRRPSEIAHKTSGNSQFAGFAYAWDKTDNPLMEARSHKSGTGDVYGYDAVNRLVRVLRDVDDPAAELADPGSEVYVQKLEYEMDDVFNLTAFKLTPYQGQTSTTSFTTDAMNQYTAVGNQSLTYTDAGSLEDDGTRTYVYDAHQHLIEVWEGETQVAAYSYDALGLGRRTSKTVGSATTRYVYAGQQSIEEWNGLDDEATLSRLFVFGERIDQIVAMEAPDQADVDQDENTSEVLRFSYHTQLIGSVTHVTGPAGSVVESYEYDPYGAPTIRDAGGDAIGASAIGNAYLFTARQLDEETGLYYHRARHYSPELRRFIQRDPLEYVDGPNAVAYVYGAPTALTDATGRSAAYMHYVATYIAAKEEGYSDDAAAEMASGSVDGDSRAHQGKGHANEHSQREDGQTAQEARKGRDRYTSKKRAAAASAAFVSPTRALRDLGNSNHPGEDEPSHQFCSLSEHPDLESAGGDAAPNGDDGPLYLGWLVRVPIGWTVRFLRDLLCLPDLIAMIRGSRRNLQLFAHEYPDDALILKGYEAARTNETRVQPAPPPKPGAPLPAPTTPSAGVSGAPTSYFGGGDNGADSWRGHCSVGPPEPVEPTAAPGGRMDFIRGEIWGHSYLVIHPGRWGRVGLRDASYQSR